MNDRMTRLRQMIVGAARTGKKSRRPRQVVLSCDSLEERVTPAHIGVAHHAVAHLHAAAHHAHASASQTATSTTTAAASTTSTTTTSTSSGDSDGDGGSSSTSALSTALKTLRNDVQTIELASGTTVGELTAIRAAFETLESDGLTPSSQSALRSFEDNLVTANASGTTLAGDATLLSQFEAIYTSSPTTQETTDLTTAYNALAAAVVSANVTSADITTINTDWAAVLAAQGSSSTATYPYFQLVTGQTGRGPGFGPGGGGNC